MNRFAVQRAFRPLVQRRALSTYKSPYGPQYKIRSHFAGFTLEHIYRIAPMLSGFGAFAGIFALFFLNGVPRVHRDILEQIPIIGDYWHTEVAPEDNPF